MWWKNKIIFYDKITPNKLKNASKKHNKIKP